MAGWPHDLPARPAGRGCPVPVHRRPGAPGRPGRLPRRGRWAAGWTSSSCGRRAWRPGRSCATWRSSARPATSTGRCSRSTTAPTWRTRPGPTCCTWARTTCRRRWPGRSSVLTSVIGLSSHDEQQAAAAAARPEADYFCAGPVWPTPTKPGRPAPGLRAGQVRGRSRPGRSRRRPWFAIGGIDLSNLGEVLDAGARRVVVVRAITEADDPGAGCRGPGRPPAGRFMIVRRRRCGAIAP